MGSQNTEGANTKDSGGRMKILNGELEEDCCEAFCYALAGVTIFPLVIKCMELLGGYANSDIDDFGT
jgi:hypothetical protein